MEEIGKYKILNKIEDGGMATVFKGIQPSLDRPVAVKVLHKRFLQNPQAVERFNRESLIIARLSHPNIIHVIDRGITEEGMPYFIMDYVEGTDVSKLIKQGSLALNQKIDIIVQICKALSYAHKNNVIHRDIKPANILLDAEGYTRVTDFGIAQLFEKQNGDGGLTKEHSVVGTPAYMSPEQKINPKAITAASDLFSLGMVMYELITGTKPLGHFKPPSEHDPRISPALDALILKCLEPEPGDRPASADAVKDPLLELLQGAHIRESKKKEAVRGVAKVQDLFTLLDIIKEHSYGKVYLFKHKINGALMVVKRFQQPMGGRTSARLFMELKHPHIADVYGVSGDRSDYIIVMEYLSGGSLADRLVSPYPWHAGLRVAGEIAAGLSFAHKNRIIHGSLRPGNILFSSSGAAKVSGFGIEAMDAGAPTWLHNRTPKTKQADIFSLGAIFYKALTGRAPILKGNSITPHKLFKKQPRAIRQLIRRMLSQEPDKRFQSIDQVVEAMDQIQATGNRDQTQTAVLDQPLRSLERGAGFFSRRGTRRTVAVLTLLLFFIAAAGLYLLKSG